MHLRKEKFIALLHVLRIQLLSLIKSKCSKDSFCNTAEKKTRYSDDSK
jgi:hypothetical protein